MINQFKHLSAVRVQNVQTAQIKFLRLLRFIREEAEATACVKDQGVCIIRVGFLICKAIRFNVYLNSSWHSIAEMLHILLLLTHYLLSLTL